MRKHKKRMKDAAARRAAMNALDLAVQEPMSPRRVRAHAIYS